MHNYFSRLASFFLILAMLGMATSALAWPPVPVRKPFQETAGTLVIEVKQGDTLSNILTTAGLEQQQIASVITELQNIYDPGRLQLGQKVRVNFNIRESSGVIDLASLQILLPGNKEIQVRQLTGGVFLASQMDRVYDMRLVKASGEIDSTLFSAAKDAGLPAAVVLKLIQTYSYDVDFQRDLRRGDSFEVLFEQFYDEDGKTSGLGDVVYASLDLNNKAFKIYRYTTPDGHTAYYDETGRSVKKSLLRTPVDGARITSGFGHREHPILGYNKMHKGLDFGAPRGTPVYAAGDGDITVLGRNGSYGKYIKIDHGNGHATAYAHLKGYAKRLKRGSKVEQGQVIGYVGTTGRSTGPHLHYEVLVNGRQINPLSIKTVSTQQLQGVQFAIFDRYKQQIASLLSEEKTQLANAN